MGIPGMGVDGGASGEPAPGVGEGLFRWLQVQDALLRGLVHALGNRAGMVAGVADLLGVSAAPSPRMIDALRGEADRLEALLRLFRALVRERGGEADPVVLGEALGVAEALVAHHPQLAEGALTVTRVGGEGGGGVVRAPLDAVVHALCVALVAAAGDGGAVAVGVAAEEAGVTVTVRGAGEAPAEGADLAAMAWLLERVPGASLRGIPGGVALAMPR